MQKSLAEVTDAQDQQRKWREKILAANFCVLREALQTLQFSYIQGDKKQFLTMVYGIGGLKTMFFNYLLII